VGKLPKGAKGGAKGGAKLHKGVDEQEVESMLDLKNTREYARSQKLIFSY
jgi:hypothetical protein